MATSSNAAQHGGYERSDASPRGLLYFALIMAAILAALSLSLIWLFKYFEKAENSGSFVPAPFATEQPLPPGPRVQSNPGADMQSYYESQQKLLNTYGWVDRQKGIVRLPIDRAMQLLLERGLPTRSPNRPQNPPPKETGPASKPQSTGGTR
jgi:hypothetical protein